MQYIYIHGFNSGPQSRSGTELEALLGAPVHRVVMDYGRPWDQCLKELYAQLPEAGNGGEICVMGSSLGGFYALQLRHPAIRRTVAWNPVVFPALQLAPYVGINKGYYDGVEWNFGLSVLLSYARADDPRPWRNVYRNSGTAPRPCRCVAIGMKDDVLDPRLGIAFWDRPDYGIWLTTLDCGHSVPDYGPSLKWAMQKGVSQG